MTNPLPENLLLAEIKLEEQKVLLKKQKTAIINELIALGIGVGFFITAIITKENTLWGLYLAAWTMWLIQNVIYYRLQRKLKKNSKIIRRLLGGNNG